MENHSTKSKKRNYKPLYMLVVFLSVFGGFIYVLVKPSAESLAIGDLQNANNVDEVRSCWEKSKMALATDEDYLAAIRTRLSGFDLSARQIATCLTWLPKAPQSLNVIVVPDLSGRINDGLNNPGQVRNDTLLLNQVWASFEASTRLKMNSNDRLLVDVTGGNQAGGQFRALANDLIFDLSTFRDKSDKLFFAAKGRQFQNNIAELYRLAKGNPQGADYWRYFNDDLRRNIKTPTLFADYRNVVVIITDGYLEAEDKKETGVAFYTGTYRERLKAFELLKAGHSLKEAVSTIAPIMDCSVHFPNLEVLMLEVNARHRTSPQEPDDPGTARDGDLLKKMWTDWFTKLEIKNASGDFFNERLSATDLSKQKVKDFFKGVPN